MAGGGLTPEQKWRAEAIAWLNSHGYCTNGISNEIAMIKIQEEYKTLNYLLMEYLINIKHAPTNQTNG